MYASKGPDVNDQDFHFKVTSSHSLQLSKGTSDDCNHKVQKLPFLEGSRRGHGTGYSRQFSKASSNTHSGHGNRLSDRLRDTSALPSLTSNQAFKNPVRMISHHAITYNSPRLDALGISHGTKTKRLSTNFRPLFGFRSDLCHLSRLRDKRNTHTTHVNTNTKRKENLKQKKLKQIRAMKSIYLQRK